MNANDQMLAHYEAIVGASGCMLEAARAADWDALIEHERICAGLIERVRGTVEPAALAGPAAQRKAALIHQVLAHDAEIRRLTQPWLARMESMLRTGTNRRRVDGAYR